MDASKRQRGRPVTFGPETRHKLAALIRLHGVRGTRVVSPMPVSKATLIRIAREFGVTLKKGRRPKQAA